MKDNYLPASVLTDRSKPQYEPPGVILSSAEFENRSQDMDVLIDDFEKLVKLRLPYSTISYLALVTD